MLATETLKVKLRKDNLLDEKEFQKLIDGDARVLTSKQLATMVGLKSDAALRKQRSINRSLFPYCKVGRRIFYPMDLIMKTLHKTVVDAQVR
jgi:hypothetical protein|tara:strand:- start:352 stop:627 length:276 start_codon:yes stop_codon:yes gene_type:complete